RTQIQQQNCSGDSGETLPNRDPNQRQENQIKEIVAFAELRTENEPERESNRGELRRKFEAAEGPAMMEFGAFDGKRASLIRTVVMVGVFAEPGHDVNQDEGRQGDQANRITDRPTEDQLRIFGHQRGSLPGERQSSNAGDAERSGDRDDQIPENIADRPEGRIGRQDAAEDESAARISGGDDEAWDPDRGGTRRLVIVDDRG